MQDNYPPKERANYIYFLLHNVFYAKKTSLSSYKVKHKKIIPSFQLAMFRRRKVFIKARATNLKRNDKVERNFKCVLI